MAFAPSVFGSRSGGWVYERIRGPDATPLLVGLALAAGAAVLVRFSLRHLARHEAAVLALWMAAGFGFSAAVRGLYPHPVGAVVAGEANGFYGVALRHGPRELLGHYAELAGDMPVHVRANMAGKVLLFHLFSCLTASPEVLGYLVLALSTLGGLLAYGIGRDLTGDRVAGLYGLVLYLFVPARLYFLPILNTVSPVFALLPLWLFVRYLAGKRRALLVAVGTALYLLVLFDPLPLATGLVYLALMLRAYRRGELTAREALGVVTVVPAAFFAADLAVWAATGYEIVGAFAFACRDAAAFNAGFRPYGVWVAQNPVDFLVNAGVAPALLFLGLAGAALAGLARRGWAAAGPRDVLAASVFATLVVLDLSGVNRGEVIRLWIFLAVLVQLPVALDLAGTRRDAAFLGLVAVTLLQACVTIYSIGFVIPG